MLDLTEISDGKSWHKASGRASTIVTGDRSEILPGSVGRGGRAARAPARRRSIRESSTTARSSASREFACDSRSAIRRASGAVRQRQRFAGCAGVLGRIRSWSRARLFERIEPSVAPLASALILGQREGIEPEVNDAFARTGTTHLLAISGLQLQALAVALLLVLPARRTGSQAGLSALCVSTMVAYAVVVGPAPSVVRATVMTATFCLAVDRRAARPARPIRCPWPRSALSPSIPRISSMSAASSRSWRSAR